VEGAAAGVPLLHLATHAVADMASAERSRILFSPEREAGRGGLSVPEGSLRPELRGSTSPPFACDNRGGSSSARGPVRVQPRAPVRRGTRRGDHPLARSGRACARFHGAAVFELNRGKPKAEALRLASCAFCAPERRCGTRATGPRSSSPVTGSARSPGPFVEHVLGVVGNASPGRRPRVEPRRNAVASRSAGRSPPRWRPVRDRQRLRAVHEC